MKLECIVTKVSGSNSGETVAVTLQGRQASDAEWRRDGVQEIEVTGAEAVLQDSLNNWTTEQFCEVGWGLLAAQEAIEHLRAAGYELTAALSDQVVVPKSCDLASLHQAIIDHTHGDLFWIGEILLNELEKETGFKAAPASTAGEV